MRSSALAVIVEANLAAANRIGTLTTSANPSRQSKNNMHTTMVAGLAIPEMIGVIRCAAAPITEMVPLLATCDTCPSRPAPNQPSGRVTR